jgi:hydroxypyruvate isomerase
MASTQLQDVAEPTILRSVSLQFMWTDRSFPERVAAAAKAGFDLIDLWDWRTVDIDGIAAAAHDNGIGINGFFGNRLHAPCDPSDKAEFLDEVSESLECAIRVGARQLHIFSNAIRPGGIVVPAPPLPSEELFSACLAVLSDAARLAEGTGVTLMLEHLNTVFLPGYLWGDVGTAITLCRQINRDGVRVVFDAYHQQLTGGRLTEHLLAALPVLGRFDIAGVPGRTEPGLGEIDFGFLRSVLIKNSWGGTVTFEVSPSDGNPETACQAIDRIFPPQANRPINKKVEARS